MTNDDLAQWFDNKISALKDSDDPKDVRLMLELLRTKSSLKIEDKVLERLDTDDLSDDELLRMLKGG